MFDFLRREKTLLAQARELKALRAEVEALRAQNDSMRVGMRRCVTCDYRLQARDSAPVVSVSEESQ